MREVFSDFSLISRAMPRSKSSTSEGRGALRGDPGGRQPLRIAKRTDVAALDFDLLRP